MLRPEPLQRRFARWARGVAAGFLIGGVLLPLPLMALIQDPRDIWLLPWFVAALVGGHAFVLNNYDDGLRSFRLAWRVPWVDAPLPAQPTRDEIRDRRRAARRTRDLTMTSDQLLAELARYVDEDEHASIRAKVDAGAFPAEGLDDLLYHRRREWETQYGNT